MRTALLLLFTSGVMASGQIHIEQPPSAHSKNVTRLSYTQLSDAVADPATVYRLDLSGKTKSLTDDVGRLENLTELHLRACSLSSLPASLAQCAKLEVLDLSDNNFTGIPQVVAMLPNLKVLNISGNPITDGVFDGSKSLEVLFVDRCTLEALPSWLSACVQLTEVHASANHITRVPQNLASCTRLRLLDLGNNHLPSVPDVCATMSMLEELNLSGNQITELPSALLNKVGLVALNVSSNRIEALPSTLSNATLRSFDADSNQIQVVPASIGGLTALERLSLAHNRLGSLPKEIGKCTNLAFLNLSSNALTSLPVPELASLQALMWLRIANRAPATKADGTVEEANSNHSHHKKP